MLTWRQTEWRPTGSWTLIEPYYYEEQLCPYKMMVNKNIWFKCRWAYSTYFVLTRHFRSNSNVNLYGTKSVKHACCLGKACTVLPVHCMINLFDLFSCDIMAELLTCEQCATPWQNEAATLCPYVHRPWQKCGDINTYCMERRHKKC